MVDILKPDELIQTIETTIPDHKWEDVVPDISAGKFCYPTKRRNLEYLSMPMTKEEWSPAEDDWHLPDNWEEIIYEGFT